MLVDLHLASCEARHLERGERCLPEEFTLLAGEGIEVPHCGRRGAELQGPLVEQSPGMELLLLLMMVMMLGMLMVRMHHMRIQIEVLHTGCARKHRGGVRR